MSPAALRIAAFVSLFFPGGTGAPAAATSPSRSTPTRPVASDQATGPAPTPAPAGRLFLTRIAGTAHLDLEEAMARIGLKPKPREATRKLFFSDGTRELVVEPESRETAIDGLRVFLGQKIATQKGRPFVSKVDYDRCLLPILKPAAIGVPLPPPKTIVIDPGHGGSDDGMQNPRLGMKEKTFTLEVSARVKKLLETAGYKVVLTRSDDRELARDKSTDWKLRSEIANRSGAALMVSIHFNAIENDTTTRGVEVYTFTRQFQRSDRSQQGAGQDDDTDREPMPVNRFDPWSAVLAQALHREIVASLKTPDRGHKTMHSAVLRGLNCPGVLVESAFLTNDTDARLVATPAYQQKIAQAIADGILDYAATLAALRPKPAASAGTATGNRASDQR